MLDLFEAICIMFLRFVHDVSAFFQKWSDNSQGKKENSPLLHSTPVHLGRILVYQSLGIRSQ